MRFRRIGILALAFLLLVLTAPVRAVGTLTVAVSDLGGGVTKYTLTWTSTAGGAVSGNAFAVKRGELLQVKFVPDAGGTQPTDLYDVTLVDTDSVDVLAGAGANLSNAASTVKVPSFGTTTLYRYFHSAEQNLDLVVANAGAAKGGKVYLYVR
jgi:hypothetical protein